MFQGIFKGWDVQKKVLHNRCISSPTCSWTFRHLKIDHYIVSKCGELITLWCCVTSHKNRHLSYTTAKTKKLAFIIVLRWAHYEFQSTRWSQSSTPYHISDPFFSLPSHPCLRLSKWTHFPATILHTFLIFITPTACPCHYPANVR